MFFNCVSVYMYIYSVFYGLLSANKSFQSINQSIGGEGVSPDGYLNEYGDYIFFYLNALIVTKLKF